MSYLAEKGIIGALLIDGNAVGEISTQVQADMFENCVLGAVYKEYQRAFENGYNITLANVQQNLCNDTTLTQEMLFEELKVCMGDAFTTVNIKADGVALVNDWKARQVNGLLSNIKVTSGTVRSDLRNLIESLEILQGQQRERSHTLAEITENYKGQYFRKPDKPKMKIGFYNLDETITLEPGDVVVIGARPAVGKSAFATQIAMNLAKKGKRVGFYNLEMSDKQVYERFVVAESGIRLTALRSAVDYYEPEWEEKFNKANEFLSKQNNLVITTGSKSASEIKAESKHMDYDVLIIDYLQLLKTEQTYRGNRVAEVGAISKAVKSIAMDLKIPVILLSQLNRASEGKETKEPTMSELRESGDIEQDASVIMLLWNLDESRIYKGCKIEKNRQGKLGCEVLEFNGDLMRFTESTKTKEQIQAQQGKKKKNDIESEVTPFG